MVLLTQLVDAREPNRVRPLVQGRRLSELIDTLSQVLPDYPDRTGLVKALRAVNSHRDRLAHSTRGFEPRDMLNFDVQWIDRQGRSSRATHRLDVTAFRQVEREHALVYEIVISLSIGLMLASVEAPHEPHPEFSSVEDIVLFGAAGMQPAMDDAAKRRVSEILTGGELMAGFAAQPPVER